MQKDTNVIHGVKWGVIIGVLYCLFLYIRYKVGATDFMFFTFSAMVAYPIVLILLLISGFQYRRSVGGYVELKDVFRSLFVTLLIFELFYAVFNFIYLKYADPEFFRKLYDSAEAFLQNQKIADSRIEEQLKNIDPDAGQKMTGAGVVINYLMWVAVSGVFAMIFSLIIKKKRPPFENDLPSQAQY